MASEKDSVKETVMASEKDPVKETVMPVNDKPPDNVENQFGEASSVDKVTLNNKIISMRSTVKKSKVRILAKLIRHIKQLKCKIDGKPVNVEKNKRKHANLVEEMKVIKALKPDTISRFVLGNTCTFAELNNKVFQSTEVRALARFSDENLLQDIVKKFRAEHSDWKSLAAFVQTQSSGRHIKKKKRSKKTQAEKAETKTNIKAKQAMVSTFLQGKVANMHPAEEDLDSESDINTSRVPDAESSQNQKGMISNKNEELVCKDLHLKPIDSELHANREKSETVPQNWNKEIQKSKQKHNPPDTNRTVNKLKNSKKELPVVKPQTKIENVAMVVKKINLDNFVDDILIHKAAPKDYEIEKLFGCDDNENKESAFFFLNGQESPVAEETELEEVDQKNDNDSELTVSGNHSEVTVSGNHSMFLTLSGEHMPSFRDGRGRRGGSNFNSHFSDFQRQKPNFQRYQNSGQQNNFGRGRFSNRGRREQPSTYPVTKTFRESNDTSSNDTYKQKLADKSNLGEEKLHPSWEASRRRREQAANITAFQGKKTKFDD